MSGNTPVERAQFALSGEGLRRRVEDAESRALGVTHNAPPPPKKKKKKPVQNMIRPQQKFVDARQQAIERQQAADRAAIAARNANQGLRRSN